MREYIDGFYGILKVIMRWRKAAISITRGKEEASRIFDNPNATSDDTDVFFGATDPLFGNSRIRSEQETETLLLQLKRKRMQAAAELAIQNALQNAADREAEVSRVVCDNSATQGMVQLYRACLVGLAVVVIVVVVVVWLVGPSV